MSEKLSRCLKCERPLKKPRTGRPPIYCGVPCRVSAAYELKRLQRRLEALEIRFSDLQSAPENDFIRDYRGRKRVEQLASLGDEIARAESRLLALLGEGGKSPARDDVRDIEPSNKQTH